MSIIRSNSAWDAQQIETFLQSTVIPIRVGCSDGNGVPLICSLWYLYADGLLWCATQQTASVAELLERSPRCAFEIAPESMPYKGVRGQGAATVSHSKGEDVLLQLIDRYLGTRDTQFAQWLLERTDTEVAISIEPEWMNSWDFSGRMRS